MDTKTITANLKCLKNFVGVFSRDTLPVVVKLPVGLVINTDKSSLPGTHWVAIYIDADGFGEYMDSFGLRPLTSDILAFLNKNCISGWEHNPITFQSPVSSACGPYCVLFITMRSRGCSMSEFVRMFSQKKWLNDVTALYMVDP